MRRFVLGDIHGMYDNLVEVLQKCGFDYENDILYQIGDIVDRGPEPFLCMYELLRIKNLVLIKGNHDVCFYEYFAQNREKDHPLGFMDGNGTRVTVQKWNKLNDEEKEFYKKDFFEKQVDYHVTKDNILFVHGGFDPYMPIEDQECETYYWDRELIQEAERRKKPPTTIEGFKEIYLGHTPTIFFNQIEPMVIGNLINIDTGSGKTGPLTIMDIDTKEYWQSQHNFLPYVVVGKNEEKSGESKEETGGEQQTKEAGETPTVAESQE